MKSIYNLKACPFCGGIAEVVEGNRFDKPVFFVMCKSCHARTNSESLRYELCNHHVDHTEEEAKAIVVERWNYRPSIFGKIVNRTIEKLYIWRVTI